MLGVQGLYNDGWMLSGVPIRAPWQLDGHGGHGSRHAPSSSSCTTSARTGRNTPTSPRPIRSKVKEMKDLMFGEFAKYQVLPLDASASPRFVAPRPSLAAGRKVFTYSGSPVSDPDGNQPSLLNTSYTITADIDVPQGGADGVIVGEGGRFSAMGAVSAEGQAGVHV